MKLLTRKLTGQLGVNYVERIALQAGCKMIPFPEQFDTGVDGFIEFARSENATGKFVAFQVKRGPSFLADDGPRCQTDSAHLRYWRDFSVPVLLILVSEDEKASYWIDVQEYARSHPEVVDSGPYVLRPPKTQSFTVAELRDVIIPRFALPLTFDDAVSRLCEGDPVHRMSGLGMLYVLRSDRRAVFCLASTLCLDNDIQVLAAACDLYSRYLGHPEFVFDVPLGLRNYAASLLNNLGELQLCRILESFEVDDYSLDATTEIFGMTPDEVWAPEDIVPRGSVQQGIAMIVQALAGDECLRVIFADPNASFEARRAAIALFGYLGFRCEVGFLDGLMRDVDDDVLLALLTWLRFWMREQNADCAPQA